MQLEDKVVDTRDAAREERQQREDVLAHGEDHLPEPVAEVLVSDAALELRTRLVGAIHRILDRQTLSVGDFHLPALQARALEALKTAVDGRSTDLGQFVFADDRRDLLEQALAVLQPDLTVGDDAAAQALHEELATLTERVGELRHKLTDLEDAQDELDLVPKEATAAASDADDKPAPPVDPDAPRPATTLTGPELPEPPAPATTLVGPEPRAEPRPPSSLVGPELPPAPAAPSSLIGAELPPEPARASTLDGPERPAPPPAPSTLGGEPSTSGDGGGDAAAKPKGSWWRRPFG